jgi:hypothetical protein
MYWTDSEALARVVWSELKFDIAGAAPVRTAVAISNAKSRSDRCFFIVNLLGYCSDCSKEDYQESTQYNDSHSKALKKPH